MDYEFTENIPSSRHDRKPGRVVEKMLEIRELTKRAFDPPADVDPDEEVNVLKPIRDGQWLKFDTTGLPNRAYAKANAVRKYNDSRWSDGTGTWEAASRKHVTADGDEVGIVYVRYVLNE